MDVDDMTKTNLDQSTFVRHYATRKKLYALA